MAAAATISSATSTANTSFSCISPFPQTLKRTTTHSHVIGIGFPSSINRNIRGIKAAAAAETDEKETAKTVEEKKGSASASTSTSTSTPTPTKQLPKKPVYSMKKGQIVRVDKEKYLNSVNYLSVGHPPYYKGLDYIYEDRGEVLDMRIFETGEYALIAWVGIPTAPAWLPTDMLIRSEKLNYERL